MSTDTITPTAVEREPEGEKSPGRRLYEFSSWVHVGPGADECGDVKEETGEVTCGDPRHFHAWVRVPNQYEWRDISEKALAAKARKSRALRDEDSDSFVILEEELEQLARLGDEAKATVVEELIQRDWYRDFLEAEKEILETENPRASEEGEDEKLYAHLREDEVRYDELRAMDEEERPKDEYEELEKHVSGFHEAVNKRHAEIAQTKREPLMQRDINDLIDMVRSERVQGMANDAFHHTRRTWLLIYGVLKLPKGDQVWSDPQQLRSVAPEVLEACNALFDDLERMENGAQTDPS